MRLPPLRRMSHRTIELVLALALLSVFGAGVAQSHDYFRKKAPKIGQYAVSTSVQKRQIIFDIRNAAPGDKGVARLSVKNIGQKPPRILMMGKAITRSGLDPYLRLSIYDTTTKQCYFPPPKKVKPPKPKPGAKPKWPKPSGPCVGLGMWSKLPKSNFLSPKPVGKFMPKGLAAQQWQRKEGHRLEIRWAIDPSLPNGFGAKRSVQQLRWRAVK